MTDTKPDAHIQRRITERLNAAGVSYPPQWETLTPEQQFQWEQQALEMLIEQELISNQRHPIGTLLLDTTTGDSYRADAMDRGIWHSAPYQTFKKTTPTGETSTETAHYLPLHLAVIWTPKEK